MPNLRLNEPEVDALIEFMDEESQRTLAEAPAAEPETPRECCEKRNELVLGTSTGDDWDLPAASEPESAHLPARAPILGLGLLLALGGMVAAMTRYTRARPQP